VTTGLPNQWTCSILGKSWGRRSRSSTIGEKKRLIRYRGTRRLHAEARPIKGPKPWVREPRGRVARVQRKNSSPFTAVSASPYQRFRPPGGRGRTLDRIRERAKSGPCEFWLVMNAAKKRNWEGVSGSDCAIGLACSVSHGGQASIQMSIWRVTPWLPHGERFGRLLGWRMELSDCPAFSGLHHSLARPSTWAAGVHSHWGRVIF